MHIRVVLQLGERNTTERRADEAAGRLECLTVEARVVDRLQAGDDSELREAVESAGPSGTEIGRRVQVGVIDFGRQR
jgi:hypothetical protein